MVEGWGSEGEREYYVAEEEEREGVSGRRRTEAPSRGGGLEEAGARGVQGGSQPQPATTGKYPIPTPQQPTGGPSAPRNPVAPMGEQPKQLLALLRCISEQSRVFGGVHVGDVKRLLCNAFGNIHQVVYELMRLGYIRQATDTEQLTLNYYPPPFADEKEYRDNLVVVLERLAPSLAERIGADAVVSMVFLSAYQNELNGREVARSVSSQLVGEQRVLVALALSRDFHVLPEAASLYERLTSRPADEAERRLARLSGNPDYLWTLVALSLETNLRQFVECGIRYTKVVSCYVELPKILGARMDDVKAREVLGELTRLGVFSGSATSHSKVVFSEANQAGLSYVLLLEKDKLKKALKTDWGLFVTLRYLIENRLLISEDRLPDLIRLNAVTPYINPVNVSEMRLYIREEAVEVFKEVYDDISLEIKTRLGGGGEEVGVQLFFDKGVAKFLTAPIIVTLHARDSWSKKNHFPAFTYEVLSKHTIVMLSPKELGYTNLKRLAMDRGVQLESERNQVFDVLGIDVDAIRDKFTGCEWVVCDDYNTQDANGNLVQVGRLRELLGAQKSVEPSRVEMGGGGPGGAGGGGQIPDFLVEVFGEGGTALRKGEAKVVLFRDAQGNSFINLLEEVCLRLYKEWHGGDPEAQIIRKYEEFWRWEVERWLKPESKIVRVDLDYEEGGKHPWVDSIDADKLGDRLEELYASDIGFVIFRASDDQVYTKFDEKLRGLEARSNKRVRVVRLEARGGTERLAQLMWGNPPLRGELVFDAAFNGAKQEFERLLKECEREEGGLFMLATARHRLGAGEESDLHYALKVYTVRTLVRWLREGSGEQLGSLSEVRNRVLTEEGKLNQSLSVVPDVAVCHPQGHWEVFEVETLFGEGRNGVKKIQETIEKYASTRVYVNKCASTGVYVNIVMDPFGLLLHLHEVVQLVKEIRKDPLGILGLEFYTVDFEKGLIKLQEFVKWLKGELEGSAG